MGASWPRTERAAPAAIIPQQMGRPHAPPHQQLHPPVRFHCNRELMSLADGIAALHRQRQEQDRLLDIRSQVQQVHDLGNAGAGDVAEADDLGLVAHLAALKHALQTHGRRHQAEDTRHTDCGCGLDLCRARHDLHEDTEGLTALPWQTLTWSPMAGRCGAGLARRQNRGDQ